MAESAEFNLQLSIGAPDFSEVARWLKCEHCGAIPGTPCRNKVDEFRPLRAAAIHGTRLAAAKALDPRTMGFVQLVIAVEELDRGPEGWDVRQSLLISTMLKAFDTDLAAIREFVSIANLPDLKDPDDVRTWLNG